MIDLLLLLLLLGLAASLRHQSRQLEAQEQRIMAAAVMQHEWVRQQQSQQQLQALQSSAEAGVEGTNRLVQSIHQGIAAIPFEVLEAIPVTRDTARLVRGVHDLTSAGVYGSISAVNRGVGRGLRRLTGEKSGQDR